jgi:predicted ABC-class ATPase
MKTQRKLLSLLGIASIIGGGSVLSVLTTSCGGNPFVPPEEFSLFSDISVSTEDEAKVAMESVT